MITDVNGVVNGLGNNLTKFIFDKASLANQTAGRAISMWRATGIPAQGAIPTTAAVPTSATTGSISFVNQSEPNAAYLGLGVASCSNNAAAVEIHDRLAHMAGLSLASTTSQTTGLPMDLQTLGVSAARIGQTNYSEVQWWLEIYADGGATASNATINVTYSDNTSGNLNVIAVGGTLRIGNMLNLNALKPTNKQGVFIRGINSVILSASTTVAGNFGFTATRQRASLPTIIAFKTETYDWASLGLPSIANDSCLQFVVIPTTTSSGIIRGLGSIIYG